MGYPLFIVFTNEILDGRYTPKAGCCRLYKDAIVIELNTGSTFCRGNYDHIWR